MPEFDLADIQGGILRAYGRQGFPKGLNFFLHVQDAAKGRGFVEMLRPLVTTAARWTAPGASMTSARHPRVLEAIRAKGIADYPGEVKLAKPAVTVNIAFTFYGLLALGVPTRTLRGMPDEFIDGMQSRAEILGDDDGLDRWDALWRNSAGVTRVHILVSMNAQMNPDGTPVPELDAAAALLAQYCTASEGGVVLLPGNGPQAATSQSMTACLRNDAGVMKPTNKEHFDLSDGFGDPVFEGQYTGEAEKLKAIGGGKLLPDQSWAPLAAGEFLLGYPDEAQEIAGAAMPIEFSRNGAFMAYRKLHENVGSFQTYMAAQGERYGAMFGIADPVEALETVEAKLVGRWSNGVPLMAAPTYAAYQAFNDRLAKAQGADDKKLLAEIALDYVNFTYRKDPAGTACPIASHMRRVNPRDMLDPHFNAPDPKEWAGSVLNNRRRILRRGLPYGAVDPAGPDDSGEHGIIFLAVCASLFRQFEFVQQQWVQYGLDFNAGSDTCPLVGNHGADAKFIITADPADGRAPFICGQLPQLVECRGGDYFFVPSMTALRMIGMGIIDPT